MYQFKKIKNNHNRLRDDVIVLDTVNDLKVGGYLEGYGEGREFGTRCVKTSRITHVLVDEANPNRTRIHTESGSIYDITKI